MTRFDDADARRAFAAVLEDGEAIQTWAYGVEEPRWARLVPLLALRLTTHFLVGLTERRVVVLEVAPRAADVLEAKAYDLEDAPSARLNAFRHKAYLAIEDEARPFSAVFHWRGAPDNLGRVRAIADKLGARHGKPGR